ncbi:Scavenger receptor cysteine-rich type 1 protein M130 [Geodia barretti]|nr:Scavenger receptor cysteine-rich type 1 protein M130 [Geodia barretti]
MQIGFSAGCDEKYFPLSSIAGTSNIGVPGVYAFRIDQRDIIDPSKAVGCGDLPDPQNGKVKYTSTILNSLANYTCTADCDFMLTRECLTNGSWSGREPECPDVACRGLESCHPENGWLSLISESQGLVAKYGCELGYIPNNTRDTRHCECGSWSGDEIRCEEMCPEVGQDKECGKHSQILACDSRKDGISNTSKFHLNGSYEFFQEPLRSIQVYDNGSVHFNDGSLTIVVLNVTKNDGAHFFYDWEMSNPHYFNNQKRYVKCLLNMAMEDFNLKHMFIVTWKDYWFHDKSKITFQLAIVSDSSTTHALFLYGDINLEDTPVLTGLRAEDAPCHGQTFYHFPVNPLHETSSDIGISGAYILRIDEIPGGIHCNCSIDEFVNPANGEADIINTLRASWAVYDCRRGFSMTGDNPRQCINGIWIGTAPECKRKLRIRLVDPESGQETLKSGLVEVLRDPEWRSVCDDYWTYEDANVVCRQLGFLGFGAETIRRLPFRKNEPRRYWLDDVKCNGDESSLFDCPHRGWGVHNCGRRERAGVKCLNESDIDIHIVNGDMSGAVELWMGNEWRSLCCNHWTSQDARVACRQLGHSADGAMTMEVKAENDAKYWMDHVNCDGDEEYLFACTHLGFTDEDNECKKGVRAGVTCLAEP